MTNANISINDTVRWMSQDENGESFSYIGDLIGVSSNEYTISVPAVGEMTFPKNDGKITKTASGSGKPKKPVKTQNIVSKATKQPASTAALPKAGTKQHQIYELLKDKTDYTRKEAISMIVAAGISSAAGASTHYNSVKKFLN